MKIKTIDVNAWEWFDKINGNSYFSGEIIVNYGMKTEKTLDMPFEYGYGDFYLQKAMSTLIDNKLIKNNDDSLYRYCSNNNIILRKNKTENCLKKELI